MALSLLCTESGQNKASVGQKVPRSPADALGPTPLPGQGGYSGEWDGLWVGGGAPGGGPGSTSALVALRSQEAGQHGV